MDTVPGHTENRRRPVLEPDCPLVLKGLSPVPHAPIPGPKHLRLSFLNCQKSGVATWVERGSRGMSSWEAGIGASTHVTKTVPMFAFQLVTYTYTRLFCILFGVYVSSVKTRMEIK